MSGRFPRWVYAAGEEPDPRFTLANERTFLAWTRTTLALIASGIALEAIVLPVQPTFKHIAAFLLLLLGFVAPVTAWLSWARAERAMRLQRPLPASPAFAVLAAGITTVAILVTLGSLL